MKNIVAGILILIPAAAFSASAPDQYLIIGKAYADSYEKNKTAAFSLHKNSVCLAPGQNTDDGSCDRYLDRISTEKQKSMVLYSVNRRIPYYQDFIRFMDLYEKGKHHSSL